MTDTVSPAPRAARIHRATSETDIHLHLVLDGSGTARVGTGLGFVDHMLTALAKHARFDLEITATGDTHIDDHHTVEDVGLALGAALREALGDRRGIVRFGHAYAPLDEALVRTVVDLSGRPWPEVHLPFTRERLGDVATENLVHLLQSIALEARLTLHVDRIRHVNDHHLAEAAFKATALALRAAVARTGASDIPSTKGVLA